MRTMRSIFFATLMFCTSCIESPQNDEVARKVKCETLTKFSSETKSVTYPAKVVAAKDVNRAFRVAGVIEAITVNEGEFVNKGQVIAKLDKRDYELQLAATQAEYDAVKAEADRVIGLYREQSVSANDFDKATNGLKMITAKLSSHRNALEDTQLRAPFSGYIQKVYFDCGEAVSSGMPIVSMISKSAPEVVVNIPSNEYMRRGDLLSATAKVEVFRGVEFKLQYIGTTHKANLNQLYESRFRIVSPIDTLPSAGMSAMVTLNYNTPQSEELFVSFGAVVERNNKCYVWVIDNNVVHLREVEVERILPDGRAIITGEVKCGENVISAGVNSLKEGQKIEPLKGTSKSNVGNIL